MKRILLLFIVLYQSVFACFSQGEKELKGLVRTYQEEKAIRTRDIYVRHLRSKDTVFVETYSDFDGKFSIVFSNETRYPTSIIVRGNGEFKDYRVVNTYDINNIKETDTNVNVFIGNKNVINKQKELFYNVITQSIVKQYQNSIQHYQSIIRNLERQEHIYVDSIRVLNRIIEDLEKELKNKNQKIEEISEELKVLQADYLKLRNNPELMQERIAEILLDSLEVTLNYFNSGQLDKALSSNSVNQEEIEQDKRIRSIKFFRLKLKAMTFVAMGDYPNAITWYKNTFVYIDPENKIDWFFIYMNIAELEYLTGNDNNAVKYVEDANSITINKIYKIKTYNLLGKVLKSQKKDKDSRKKYIEAIDLYKELKKEAVIDGVIDNDHIADKEAAISYTLLADYYEEIKRYEAAKTNYHKALDIYTELNKIGEIETEMQCVVLLKLATIYDNENKETMVKKCIDRIDLLEKRDSSTITQDPKINLYRAIYNMQNGTFEKADVLYMNVLDYYERKSNQNLYQQEIIKTRFLSGLNQFYAKSYDEALKYFSKADTLLEKDSISLGNDFVRLKALCMAATGITIKEMGDKEKGLSLYNEARDIAKKDKKLLKDLAHLKKYPYLKKRDNIITVVCQVVGLGSIITTGTISLDVKK